MNHEGLYAIKETKPNKADKFRRILIDILF